MFMLLEGGCWRYGFRPLPRRCVGARGNAAGRDDRRGLKAAAVTLAGSSVSGGALAPDRNSATEYLFESPSAIIRDPVTVVATATLAGWAGVGDNGDCATELLLPLRPVEATCPTLDISIGGRGGHNAVARGWAFTTKAQPAATAVLPKIPHSNCCKRVPWPSG